MLHTLAYQDDQILSYAEYGDPLGDPVLVQHGLIASIKDGHLFGPLTAAGRRVLCIARPGYGQSSPYPMACIAEYGTIVSALVEKLGLRQFDVLGMSSGAPYSYALAHCMPERIGRVAIYSGTPALYDARVLAHWPYPVDKSATIAEMVAVAQEVFFADVSDQDRRRNDIRDAMAHDCFGVAQDLCLRAIDWGFGLSGIPLPVTMQHSREDSEVPFITAELTARMLPHGTLEPRAGAHFDPVSLDRFLASALTGS